MAVKIDVVFIRGGQGGFEIVMNRACAYLVSHGYDVRYVQLMPSAIDWAFSSVTHLTLYDTTTASFTYDDARARYAELLKQDTEKPALILASGWPMMVYVAKGASQDAGVAVPVCAWLHGDIRFYEESDSGGMDVLQYADMCMGINHTIASDIHKAYPGKVVYRINNTIDPDNVAWSDVRDTHHLAYVGRLAEEKAVPFILHALARAKTKWRLTLVGEGEEEDALRKLARQLRISERVIFAGWQTRPWDMLTDCRALVVSSLYEGGPLCAIEALASGMEVISTPCGFVPDLIREGENGYLWPFGDPDALARLLDRIYAKPFARQDALLCKESMQDYLPENALYDFERKIDACVRLTALPVRLSDEMTDYMVRRTE